ncbi:MAG: sigma factor-like helix-turn-helix DNA-binding protein [Gordonibacter sp.]|nr:sigma factor-like helix-turn-helix DNA-binding protein [Gordonibacter sp.]
MKPTNQPRRFKDEEHEKAWLIVYTQNYCRDVLKSAARKRTAELPDDLPDNRTSTLEDETLQAVLSLPAKYKTCVYLYYYEGYRTADIARARGLA